MPELEEFSPIAGARSEEPDECDLTSISYQPGEAKFIATGGAEGEVVLWDRQSGKMVTSAVPGDYDWCGQLVNQVEFGADGETLITCGCEFVIRLLSVPGLEQVAELQTPGVGQIDSLSDFVLSADGSTVATAGCSYLQVWDVSTQESTFLFRGNSEEGTDYFFGKCALSPDGKIFVAEEGFNLHYFKLGDDQDSFDCLVNAHQLTEGAIRAMHFSPDGERFASIDKTRNLKIWQVSW